MPHIIDTYSTVERDCMISDVVSLIQRHFSGKHLLISAYDSSVIQPSGDEVRLGWRSVTAGMLSPPLHRRLDMPHAGYDEWWIFSTVHEAASFPDYQRFVNFTSWTLRPTDEITRDYDPTWEKNTWDWIVPHQTRFWEMIDLHRPLAYVCDGGRLVCVSSDRAFLDAIANLPS